MAGGPSLSMVVISQAMKAFFVLVSSSDALPEFAEIVDVDLKNAVTMKMCFNL